MDVTTLLTGSGTAALVVAIAYLGRLVLDWRGTGTARKVSAVNDAATTNAILLGSLREERAEVQRLSEEVAELREQNATLYQQMRQQRMDYESEVSGLRQQLNSLTRQVEAFQRRISSAPWPEEPK